MRDNLCNEENLKSTIEFNLESIEEDIEEIKLLEEDIIKGIQRYDRGD